MAKTYYSAFHKDGSGDHLHSGCNSTSMKMCVEIVFSFLTHGLDDEDESMPFDDFPYEKKELYVNCIYDIQEHTEKLSEEDTEDVEEDEYTDEDSRTFLHEYGSNRTEWDDNLHGDF